MECPFCHNAMPPGATFCPACGRRPMDYVTNGPFVDDVNLFTAFTRYAQFHGRARRKEYWLFMLLTFLAGIVGGILDSCLEDGIVSALFTLALILPGIAVSVRRLHDTGRSGFWIFIGCVPLIGGIILLFFYLQDSQPGPNAYGPNPKGY